MIREEFSFYDIADYLYKNNDLLIVGAASEDERSHYLFKEWNARGKDILVAKRVQDEKLHYSLWQKKSEVCSGCIDLCMGTPKLLQYLNVAQKSVLLDMSSLDHVLIMFLTKQLVQQVVPRSLFATYIRPERYVNQVGSIGISLSTQVQAIAAVPSFNRRDLGDQTLCAFLGFEGIRLKNVLETVHNVERFIPIIAFPSGTPQWYNVAMWNSMDTLQSECNDPYVYKCCSESIFDAVDILEQHIRVNEKVVLAPLGTRPHSMACALFACKHPHTRIIYDYVVEHQHRAIGISEITVYHLSAFLKA